MLTVLFKFIGKTVAAKYPIDVVSECVSASLNIEVQMIMLKISVKAFAARLANTPPTELNQIEDI